MTPPNGTAASGVSGGNGASGGNGSNGASGGNGHARMPAAANPTELE